MRNTVQPNVPTIQVNQPNVIFQQAAATATKKAVIYPNRINLTDGVELVNRLKCPGSLRNHKLKSCSYETFFPEMIQHHIGTFLPQILPIENENRISGYKNRKIQNFVLGKLDFLNGKYRTETIKENFHSINGDISMRACMFCGRNLFTSAHYRYCSTELHRKSDSLICYKCEKASKKGKLKSVIEKLREVLDFLWNQLHCRVHFRHR